jgi:hypothetical protein
MSQDLRRMENSLRNRRKCISAVSFIRTSISHLESVCPGGGGFFQTAISAKHLPYGLKYGAVTLGNLKCRSAWRISSSHFNIDVPGTSVSLMLRLIFRTISLQLDFSCHAYGVSKPGRMFTMHLFPDSYYEICTLFIGQTCPSSPPSTNSNPACWPQNKKSLKPKSNTSRTTPIG